MSLVLEEFYNTYESINWMRWNRMHTVGVSSVTGEGVNDLMDAIASAKEEYFSVFLSSIKVFWFE